MQVTNITARQFSQLKELPLEIINTEAQLFLYNKKEKWNNLSMLLKKFYNDIGEGFSNKLYTINELIDNREKIDIEELILPDSLAAVNDQVVGYIMPYIPSYNFQEVMASPEFPTEKKIGYLKEIGIILERMKNLREYSTLNGFYLNDIHEPNFILNKETGKINVVDLDSCKISHNLVCPARYLNPMSQIQYVGKYKEIDSPVGGVYEITDNTEIYCYIVMIFNYLFGNNIANISIGDFYVYLDYLSNIGVPKEFIDKISCIYIDKQNENPYEYLEELIPFVGRTHKNVFEKVRKRF